MPLTTHMIHPRVSLLTSAASMIGCQSPMALSLAPRRAAWICGLQQLENSVGMAYAVGACNGDKDNARTRAALDGATGDLNGGLFSPWAWGGRGGAVPLANDLDPGRCVSVLLHVSLCPGWCAQQSGCD